MLTVHAAYSFSSKISRISPAIHLRFTGKAGKIFFFCATHLVPAPKVHRESKGKKTVGATRPVPAPTVHRESKENFFLRYAPRARA